MSSLKVNNAKSAFERKLSERWAEKQQIRAENRINYQDWGRGRAKTSEQVLKRAELIATLEKLCVDLEVAVPQNIREMSAKSMKARIEHLKKIDPREWFAGELESL